MKHIFKVLTEISEASGNDKLRILENNLDDTLY